MVKLSLSKVSTSVATFTNTLTLPFRKASMKANRKAENNSLWAALKTKEVQRKLWITVGLIVVYRVLAAVPLPGIDLTVFNEVFGNNPVNNLFTLVTGGRLDNPSVVAIGLGAYINASIILQLLTSVVPKLEELSKEGERGRRVINMYTRILTVPLSMIQAYVIYTVLRTTAQSVPELAGLIANISTLDIVTMIAALTAGSMVLMWLGELITEYGIGNGTSIIISISILSVLPGLIVRDFNFIQGDLNLILNGNFNALFSEGMVLLYITIIALAGLIYGITFVTESTRKIVIQYASRVRAAQSGQSSYLPLKINQAGVMPVIFASALLTFPQILAQLLVSVAEQGTFFWNVGNSILNSFLGQGYSQGDLGNFALYEVLFLLMIVFFTYFYTFVTYKPGETADNLKKGGGFIPGIRPGKETENFIKTVLIRLTFWGALFLGIVSIIPSLIRLLPQGANIAIFSGIGGTSLLIVVAVITDTIRKIRSEAVTRSYDQFK